MLIHMQKELLRKYKLEKRIGMMKKEKENFLYLIKKYEDRFLEKILITNKTIKKLEVELSKVELDVNKYMKK